MPSEFAFGAKTTSAPTFGTGSITFGAPPPQTQPAFNLTTPVTTQQALGGFQFGAPTTTTTSTNLFGGFKPTGLGTPTTQTSGLFGASLTSATGGFSLATPVSTASIPTTGLTFGTPTTTSAGVSFGTPLTTATGLSFGNSATPNTTSAFSSGTATAAPTGSLSFGALTTQTPSLFSSNPPATSTTTPSLGSSFSTVNTTLPNLGLGIYPTTSTTGGLSLGLGSFSVPPPTSATTGLSFGLGGNTTTISTPGTTTSVPTTIGLGGVQSTQTKIVPQKEIPPKEQPLPNEIQKTVDEFKEVVKQQKLYSSDIARCSVRDFKKVEQEIDHLTNVLSEVEGQLQKNRHLAEKLKYDMAKCSHNVEMAQRTQDTPPGLQYENTAPLKFFMELADQFEREMQALKFQIDSVDKYVKNHQSPDALTPQDLVLGMRRLHETFVALAGRLQTVHNAVESQKETYLNIRRQIYNDATNPFESLNKPKELTAKLQAHLIYSPPKVATGPTPFNNLPLGNGNPLLLQQNQSAATPYGGGSGSTAPGQTGFGSSIFSNQFTTQSSSTPLFGGPTNQLSFGTNFQLHKPPTGNKRGKQ